MKKIALLIVSVFLAACGSNTLPDQDDCCLVETESVGVSACPVWRDCNTDPCEFTNCEVDPPATKTLTLRLRNMTDVTRQCSDVMVAWYNSAWPNGLETTVTAPPAAVGPGQEIVGTITVPHGKSLSANGGCWKFGTEREERLYGSWPLTMNANKDCVMIYASHGTGLYNMTIQCSDF